MNIQQERCLGTFCREYELPENRKLDLFSEADNAEQYSEQSYQKLSQLQQEILFKKVGWQINRLNTFIRDNLSEWRGAAWDLFNNFERVYREIEQLKGKATSVTTYGKRRNREAKKEHCPSYRTVFNHIR